MNTDATIVLGIIIWVGYVLAVWALLYAYGRGNV